MINNRLKKWSEDPVLEDLLLKTPNTYPYSIKSPMLNGQFTKIQRVGCVKRNQPSDLCIEGPKAIVINVCSNKAVMDKRRLIPILLALELITGQRGLLTKARKSSAAFRLKKGMDIGVKITLKKSNMWNFLDKLTHIILPTLIYFNKLKNNKISYDRSGNLAIGLEDISVFPEIDWLRESQHPLAQGFGNSSFITGADILIVMSDTKGELLRNCKSPNLSKIKCESSSLQLFN